MQLRRGMGWGLVACGALGVALTVATGARAQDGGDEMLLEDGPPIPYPGVEWEQGPTTGSLGSIADLDVPDGWWFTGPSGAATLMEAMENPVSGREKGLIMPPVAEGDWYAVFEFNEIGFVEDDDRDELDADAILDSIREGTEASNEVRRSRGWATMEIVGWETSPRYDPATNNLEWAIRASSTGVEGTSQVVNHNVRLLGRKGVMEVAWVGAPADLPGALPTLAKVLAGHDFKVGQRYSEYRSGDKIAEYGLAGLITGGAVAVALKTGFLQKFWKLILVGLAAVGGFFKKLFGGKKSERRPRRISERRTPGSE